MLPYLKTGVSVRLEQVGQSQLLASVSNTERNRLIVKSASDGPNSCILKARELHSVEVTEAAWQLDRE
ncbi:hypothetical protein [Novipirellula artificiosorum]|uniref:hypothetical protein n=1 Tax=Novipirellula artificiosorum TaxID=2528016 RepID=UPI0011B50B75|nr:hypothetical protein [Novipirellula artificiosorum]